jgi:hypothetical protein
MAHASRLHPAPSWGIPLLCAAVSPGALGCSGSIETPPISVGGESSVVERLTDGSVEAIDLLLMIDNSRTMADKQAILASAVPDLVERLVNPRCIDAISSAPLPHAEQPQGPLAPCPAGALREFAPVLDIHIGVITSSLGGHGSDSCPDEEKNVTACASGETNTTNDDKGHLISRKSACQGGVLPTYDGKGFLAWDPAGKLSPPGESQVGDPDGAPGLVPAIRDLVIGAGQVGCGYESQLESWYRFLVDPTPYDHIEIDSSFKAAPIGVDETLLRQRADFLRPRSVLAIVMLTDEDDCSIKEYGQFYLAAQLRDLENPNKQFYLPRARAVCEIDPNDACCTSCDLAAPAGCLPPEEDPSCQLGPSTQKNDSMNLRCWDQKRRFGVDFLYGTDRYVKALTEPTVQDRSGNVVSNPIFTNPNPDDADGRVRDPSLVVLAGIVGVPWQDIARDPADLAKGFKNAGELDAKGASGHSTWDVILGDPAANVRPLDPHMIATPDARSGVNPITGTALAPPGSPSGADPINGHEYTVGVKGGVFVAQDDLQYACIFDLPPDAQRHCFGSNLVSCDCTETGNDNPLCEPDPTNPNDPSARTLQVRAKAYPGLRHLAVLKGLGPQGVVASVCAKQVTDASAADYGYRPAVASLIEKVAHRIAAQCLPRTLAPGEDGRVSCTVLEASADPACACDASQGRAPVDPALEGELEQVKLDPAVQAGGLGCVCQIQQLSGDALAACQSLPAAPASPAGWCYVDATSTPPTGNPDLVKACPANEKREIRFLGAAHPQSGAVTFLTCHGE